MKKVYLFVTLVMASLAVSAQTTYTAIGGDWATGSTWNGGSVPAGTSGSGPRNIIVIPAGVTVTLSGSVSVAGNNAVDLEIYGVLKFENTSGPDLLTLRGTTGNYSKITVYQNGVVRPSCGGNSGVSCPATNTEGIKLSSVASLIYDVTWGQIYGPQSSVNGSQLGGSANGSPLPVKFSNIKASEKGTGVQIDWTTYSEQNLANYQIERSSDGINFSAIGEVAPRNVAAETQYNFFDALPLSGTSFYRIRNNDIDGKSGLSNIVKLNLNKNIKTIGIYPNPVIGNRVSFQTSDLAKGAYNVEVINAFGNRVFQQSVNHAGGAINQLLNLPNLQSGQYTLRITGASTSTSHKISILQ